MTTKPDRTANFYEGDHEDQHGKFKVFWHIDAWYYDASMSGGGDDGPFDTSFDAYNAASGYGR